MSGDRADLSGRRASDRPAADGASLAQRLADEYADSSAPLLRPLEGEQPVMQQQQQAQPKDDDKKE